MKNFLTQGTLNVILITSETQIMEKFGGNMKKLIQISMAATLLFLGLTNLAAAYDRTVLVENFTNWG